jgi:phospholipase/carboxylesterase
MRPLQAARNLQIGGCGAGGGGRFAATRTGAYAASTMSDSAQAPSYEDALSATGAASLAMLAGLEGAMRRLHPPEIPRLQELLTTAHGRLTEAVAAFRMALPPEGLESFHDCFAAGAEGALAAADAFVSAAPGPAGFPRLLKAMRELSQALESFYRVHRLPPLSRFFVEAPWHGRLQELDPPPTDEFTVGIHHVGAGEERSPRGGFSLYIPERYDGSRALPLVVALHGGSGNGRDFLWTWLREARGRQFALLAPTARGSTWSLMGPDHDLAGLYSMIDWVGERWRLDMEHVLLTGLSDGATYSLIAGLREDSPFTALAPISGVLHPAVLAGGGMNHVAGRRIYLVHGALDWMFPVDVARMARDELTKAGADLVYRELEDLSHTYPREENDRILSWFDPSLALPQG